MQIAVDIHTETKDSNRYLSSMVCFVASLSTTNSASKMTYTLLGGALTLLPHAATSQSAR